MLGWPLTYAVVALLAAAFAFSGIDGAAETIGRILFTVFAALCLLTVLFRKVRGKHSV